MTVYYYECKAVLTEKKKHDELSFFCLIKVLRNLFFLIPKDLVDPSFLPAGVCLCP